VAKEAGVPGGNRRPWAGNLLKIKIYIIFHTFSVGTNWLQNIKGLAQKL
jgi:hypothetical protein